MEHIIEIEHLNKSFGKLKAVDDLSFHVRPGELFAFLGVNGAGKSTTISIMCNRLKKDSGSVKICGMETCKNSEFISDRLGVVFQTSLLDRKLSVLDNLKYRAALYGINGKLFESRLYEFAEMLDFKDLLPHTLGNLSGGQRRRIDIARALLHKPQILILDEPTTGLDPQTRKLLWDVVQQLRKNENLTVFLTTHYMEEAADADYVVILDSGKIAAKGTPLELKNNYTGDFITLYNVTEDKVKSLNTEYERINNGFRVSVANTAAATRLIVKNPGLFNDYEIVKGKMDDVFLAVTGKKLVGGSEK